MGPDENTSDYIRLCSQFEACLEVERREIDGSIVNRKSSLSNYLSFWRSYIREENEMFGRLTSLLLQKIASENALNKALSINNPLKTIIATHKNEEKDKHLRSASEMAEAEIRRVRKQRMRELKECLIAYTEEQIHVARDTIEALELCINKIKSFTFSNPPDLANDDFEHTL